MQVVVCVDMTGPAGTVSFAVNGQWFHQAFTLPPRQPNSEFLVFPHVLIKNAIVRVEFAGASARQPIQQVGSYRPWQVTGE